MDMGAPQSGQYGTNSDGTRIAFCSRTILLTTVSLSYVRLWQGFEHIKQSLLVKSSFLKTMVYICCQHEVILALYQMK